MSDLEVLQHTRHERTEFPRRCQAQHAVPTPHDPHNDPNAVALLTELFASWGQRVEHGVFDVHLQEAVAQFQYNKGVHPDNGCTSRPGPPSPRRCGPRSASCGSGQRPRTGPPAAQLLHDVQACEWLLSCGPG